jgi:hypothetical protein
MANMPNTIIKNRKEKTCILKDVAIPADRNVTRKETESRDTANVEHEMYDYTGNIWSHRKSNRRFKEQFGSQNRKTVNRFTTKDSCTCNITHNTESIAVWNLTPERWGSQLVQEQKYQGEEACDRRHTTTSTTITTNNNNSSVE